MNKYLAMAIGVGTIAVPAAIGYTFYDGRPIEPPTAEAAQWASRCRPSPTACVGDMFVFKDGTVGRYEPLIDGDAILMPKSRQLSRVARVVEVNGDPATYGRVSQAYYANRR